MTTCGVVDDVRTDDFSCASVPNRAAICRCASVSKRHTFQCQTRTSFNVKDPIAQRSGIDDRVAGSDNLQITIGDVQVTGAGTGYICQQVFAGIQVNHILFAVLPAK